MALDEYSGLDPLSGFACSSCGTHTYTTGVCKNCHTVHNNLGEPIQSDLGDCSEKLIKEIEEAADSYREGLLGVLTLSQTRWTEKSSTDISIEKIEDTTGRYQRLFIRFGTTLVRLETNGELIKNYARKVNTKNGRGKGYRWKKISPAKAIQEFLEEKLGAKFAQS